MFIDKLQDYQMYYIAHPLLTYGDEQKNRSCEKICYDTLQRMYPNTAFVRPLMTIPPTCTEEAAMVLCVDLMMACDGIVLCGDWMFSTGCRNELDEALANNKNVAFYDVLLEKHII